jgi:dinuclear metal center YbgI/SA1388 family protein
MTKIKEVTVFLQSLAPIQLQEDYDNAGLIVGNEDEDISGVIICLDCIESIVDEAININANLIIAHHPIVFKGLKKFNGSNYVEKTIIKAIKNNIAIYAIHTNLDNVYKGVNDKIAEKIQLINRTILSPKSQMLRKISFYIPETHVEKTCLAMHEAGAGNIGEYGECSFRSKGVGTFVPSEKSNPFSGQAKEKSFEEEIKVEMLIPTHATSKILAAMKKNHPYEEVAYFITEIINENQEIGAGMMGELEKPMKTRDFLDFLKDKMELKTIKHSALLQETVKKIALCGGSGSFLTKQAIHKGADVYITADVKYHEFFDSDNKIVLIDIGHFESEKYTIELLYDLISNKFSNFALHSTSVETNPVNFY